MLPRDKRKPVFGYDKDRYGYFLDPHGSLVANFEELMAAGCIQAETDNLRQMFHGLMAATGCNPCAGCPVWRDRGPACEAFKRYHTSYELHKVRKDAAVDAATKPHGNSSNPELASLPMREIAKKLGISLGEARRRKAAGTL